MVKVAYFDGADLEFDPEDDLGAPDVQAAINAFLALTPADRLKDSRHVHAYYQDYREAVGGQDWMDQEMGIPETAEAIWNHVQPGGLGIWRGHGDDHSVYVFAECNCDWEVEHGLLLVWRNGAVLNKAGGFDGHATNAEDGEPEVVYSASDPAYTTFIDA